MALSRLVRAVCLLLALAPAPAGAQRRVEVYKAKHRTADELVGVAEAVMAGNGSVALDPGTNSLVLIGDPGTVSEALALLATQDRSLRSVLLRYDTRRVRDLAAQGFQVHWTASAGEFRLGNLGSAPASEPLVQANTHASSQRLAESFTGKMRVAEGATTRIETGTMVPYTTQSLSGTSTEFVNATTGFDGQARILGDGRVEVDLAAFARQLRPDRNIDVMRASTLVVVKPGAVVVVGSLDHSGAARQNRTFEGARSDQSRDETVLLLRADVENEAR